ncbi:MAG: hypothetical protein JXJ04_26630 [Spirochaetales bacterium]|nr:hypothetical protein [Spirochaetales bacterium]
MPKVSEIILREIEEDPSIKSVGIVVTEKKSGILKKQQQLHLSGTVKSKLEKNIIMKIIKKHTTDESNIIDELEIE